MSTREIKVTLRAKDNVAKALKRKVGVVEVCTAGHALYKGDPKLEKFYYSVGFAQAEKKLGVKLDRRASYLIYGKTVYKMKKTKKGRVIIHPAINAPNPVLRVFKSEKAARKFTADRYEATIKEVASHE